MNNSAIDQCEILDKAMNHFWNFNLSESENILLPHIPKLPLFSLLYADIAFVKSVLTETKEDYEEARNRISQCKKLSRGLQLSQKPLYIQQEKDEKKTGSGANGAAATQSQVTKAEYLISKLIYAETMVMKGVIEFKAQNNIKACVNLRNSWKQYYQAFDIIKELPSTFPIYNHLVSLAYYGVGIFHFLVSVVPPQYMWLIEGIGFKGNRMEGLKEIKQSSESPNGIRSNMSKVTLVLLHVFFFEDYKSAEPLIESLTQQYPNGALIHYLSGAILRKQGKVQQSTVSYAKACETSSQLKQLQLFIESELGYNEFLNLKWDTAETYLSKFLSETTSSGFKAFIAYQLALCYEMQGKNDQATETMKTIPSYVRKGFDFDEFSGRKSSKFLKQKGYRNPDKAYLIASLLNEAHQFEESIKVLEESLSKNKSEMTNDDIASHQYLLGSNYQMVGKKEEAKKLYLNALSYEKLLAIDYFVIPYSNAGLAEISFAENKKPDCKNYIKKAKGYTSNQYDFPSVLDWRIRKVAQQIGEY
ncbi:hypothetical protein DICPUDRAFT_81103 [Dictyostelium purpureum]|uniref:Uncharacterized protein n=1 Tax=Dictyostelium purpureum TaxID=5786 RepID=F0ZSH6_DICPU|nr:uncharacterized protein DICPUDRAFT_81103 [Dictyostelium purpureum]EGC33092.1 hypothetical protein DICPUDRAFT_81103 [Dictyostelium purpureum]|eukprot:XP_003290369.1 hypothetical protein DICPUDRAFT_81103 [Dictyostelium purpureum]